MSECEKFVEQAIQMPVTIFSKTYCPYCSRVKNMLRDAGAQDLNVIELDKRNDCDAVQDALYRLTGARTVPRVFIGGISVGGSDDVAAMANNGTLKTRLKKAGAITNSAYGYGTVVVLGVTALAILGFYVFRRNN